MLQFLEWIKWHSTHADQLLSEVTNTWDAHQDYWTAVRLQLGSPPTAGAVQCRYVWFTRHMHIIVSFV